MPMKAIRAFMDRSLLEGDPHVYWKVSGRGYATVRYKILSCADYPLAVHRLKKQLLSREYGLGKNISVRF